MRLDYWLAVFHAFFIKIGGENNAYLSTVFALSFLVLDCLLVVVFIFNLDEMLGIYGFTMVSALSICIGFIFFDTIQKVHGNINLKSLTLIKADKITKLQYIGVGIIYVSSGIITWALIVLLNE